MSEAAGEQPVPYASDGRVPGPRGLATRARLLDKATEMLATTPYRELRVTDVARSAGTSPATFYQYFVDVEAALLALAESAADDGRLLAEPIEGRPWRGAAGWESAVAVVDRFLEFWRERQPVLRVVNLLAEEGDERFRLARTRMLNGSAVALARVIAEAQRRSGRREGDPAAMAAALVTMLAHVSAHQSGMESWAIRVRDLRVAMARLIFWGVTGPRTPAASLRDDSSPDAAAG